jgi:DNA-binding LacI/PurR family transcriptional regulator
MSHVAETRERNWEKGRQHDYITSAISRSSAMAHTPTVLVLFQRVFPHVTGDLA